MRIEHTRASFACGCSKEVWPDTSTRIEEDLQERLTAIFFLLLIFAAEIVFAFTAYQPNRMSLTTTCDPFIPGTIPFAQYVEQLEWLFVHNNYTEDRYKASFLAVCGTEVYSQLKLLFPGRHFKDLAYKDMVEALKKRYDRKDSEVIHSYKFWTRKQGQYEKSIDFVLEVKHLAEDCDFGEFKDRAIRDVLVIGVYDRQLQKRLFDEDDLTAAKAEKIIVNQEWVAEGTNYIKKDDDRRAGVVARLGRRPDKPTPPKSNFRNRSRSNSRDRSFASRTIYRGRFDDRRSSDYSRDYGKQSYLCSYCKKKGHIRKYCYKLKRNSSPKAKASVNFADSPKPSTSGTSGLFKRLKKDMESDAISDSDDDDMRCMMISSVNRINNPCYVEVVIEKRGLSMEIDCGSAESVISEKLFTRNFSHLSIKPCNKRLVVIDGNRLKVTGKVEVSVKIGNVTRKLYLVVLQCQSDFTPLMGRTWLDMFYSGWRETFACPTLSAVGVNTLKEERTVFDLKSKFPTVIDRDFSKPIVGYEGDLVLKENTPISKKAYQVPLRLKQKVLDYLDGLERDGIITPVVASEWASPVIAVVKKNQDIRLVIDCKVSINKVLVPNTYPLPVAQDIFATLAGSKVFCSLDLEGAYTQLPLTERSKRFMVINTLKGLFVYNRLPQGASPSASIFQKVMEQVLHGLEHVTCYLDDVLISGKNFEDCRRNLYLVLERLAKANIKVNFNKCKFFVNSLPHLGHVRTDQGLLPCPEKVETIREAKAPQNVSELKAFLGIITYYSKFIPNLSTRIRCLYALLKKHAKYVWSEECNEVFNDCK